MFRNAIIPVKPKTQDPLGVVIAASHCDNDHIRNVYFGRCTFYNVEFVPCDNGHCAILDNGFKLEVLSHRPNDSWLGTVWISKMKYDMAMVGLFNCSYDGRECFYGSLVQ